MYSQHTHSVESFSLPIRGKVKVFGARRTIHVNPLYERNLVKLSCSAQFLPNVFHGASQFVHSRKWICQKSNETLVPLETFYLFHLNICFFVCKCRGCGKKRLNLTANPKQFVPRLSKQEPNGEPKTMPSVIGWPQFCFSSARDSICIGPRWRKWKAPGKEDKFYFRSDSGCRSGCFGLFFPLERASAFEIFFSRNVRLAWTLDKS